MRLLDLYESRWMDGIPYIIVGNFKGDGGYARRLIMRPDMSWTPDMSEAWISTDPMAIGPKIEKYRALEKQGNVGRVIGLGSVTLLPFKDEGFLGGRVVGPKIYLKSSLGIQDEAVLNDKKFLVELINHRDYRGDALRLILQSLKALWPMHYAWFERNIHRAKLSEGRIWDKGPKERLAVVLGTSQDLTPGIVAKRLQDMAWDRQKITEVIPFVKEAYPMHAAWIFKQVRDALEKKVQLATNPDVRGMRTKHLERFIQLTSI